jgi:vitamin B12 transporter
MKRAWIFLIVAVVTSFAAARYAAAAGPSAGPSGAAALQPAGKQSHDPALKPDSSKAAHKKPQENAAKKKHKQAETQPEQRLAPIVVTATRIPQPISQVGTTVTVLGKDQIDAQKIETVGSALREVPGVIVTQQGSPGSLTEVSIRGSTASQTLVMVDGVELNTGSTGGFDLANLTTDGLDRIEVLRGAGGSLYGSQAIGGVVNLITEEGEGTPHASFLSEGGNDATERQILTLGGQQGRLHYAGALSYFSTDGFRKLNDNSDNLAGSLRLDYDLTSDTTLRAFARYYRAEVGLPNFSVASGFALDPSAHERNEFMLYNGEIDHRFSDRLVARVSAFFVRNDVRVNSYQFPANPSSERDHDPDEMRGSNGQAVYTWAPGWRTVVGFDFEDLWARPFSESSYPPYGTFLTLFSADRQQYAGYVEQEGSLLHGLILGTAGFRVDGNSQFGKEVSPSWSVAIPLANYGLTFRGSYAEGFRAPSFDELYFPGYGNPNLAPELSSEYDGGFTEQFSEWGSFTATYFSRRVHNLIVPVPCPFSPTCPYGAMAGNAGRVDVQGVEIVPSIGPFYGVTLSGNFTTIDETHVSSSPTIRPLRVPRHSAFGLLQYVGNGLLRPDDKTIVSFAYYFVGDRDDITPIGTIASHDAYHVFDLTAIYDLHERWRMIGDEQGFVRVQNLFDRNYSETFGFPSPPINFVAGLKVAMM